MNGGRRWRLVAVAIASGVAVLVAATAVLFLWPRTDGARPADAVVVLGGDGPRLAEGKALVRAGVARTLAVSVGSPYDACYRDHEPYTVICFRPDPLTTQGEARWIGATAKARAWHDVVVVVSAPQAVRAKLRIRRCYRGGLQVVAVHVGATTAVGDAVYEWGALLKALTLQRAC